MNFVGRSFALAVLTLVAVAAPAQTLRVGLAEDPDVLDPTLARSFVGRVVFAGLCDKLFDIDEKLQIVPQLATGYEWSADSKALTLKIRPGVTFHDGELLVDVEQLVAERREDDPADEGARQRRVEDVGVLGEADAQRLRVRCGRSDESERRAEERAANEAERRSGHGRGTSGRTADGTVGVVRATNEASMRASISSRRSRPTGSRLLARQATNGWKRSKLLS